jgi:OOP family OmpA-OmpF porin
MAGKSRLARRVAPFLLLLPGLGSARADCALLDREVKAAIAAGNATLMPNLAARVAREGSCDSAYVEAASRSMALATLAAGRRDDGSFAPESVKAAAAIARPWTVSLALGDLAYRERDFAGAASAYEQAIDDIRDRRLVPKAPPREVEEYLAKRAYQAKSLAPTYVASRGRSGAPGGVLAPTYRNFTIVAVPVPIRFETDEATLTGDGEKAVDDLFAFLQSRPVKHLVLTGHTDERGTSTHNDALSLARAVTVASALRRRGLTAQVEVRGVGEQEPFAADDRSKYGLADLYAFDRRVEYEIGE